MERGPMDECMKLLTWRQPHDNCFGRIVVQPGPIGVDVRAGTNELV